MNWFKKFLSNDATERKEAMTEATAWLGTKFNNLVTPVPKTFPYNNTIIYEQIENAGEEAIIEHYLQMNAKDLDIAIAQFNTRVALRDPSLTPRMAVLSKKAIVARQGQIIVEHKQKAGGVALGDLLYSFYEANLMYDADKFFKKK